MEQCARGAARGSAVERVRQHILCTLVCLGRHTVTQHIATAGRQFVDWTADYRLYSKRRVDTPALFAPVRRTVVNHLPAETPLVAALDDTRLKKSSRNTPGVKYTRDPLGPPFHVNFMLAQRFVQLSVAWPHETGLARMIPVDLVHAPVPKKPAKRAPEVMWITYRQRCREQALGRVGQQRLRVLRTALDNDGEHARTLVGVVDGGYTNRTFLRAVPERTTIIGRIRGDAKLYYLPEEQPQKGRRRLYGPPAPTPNHLRGDTEVPWQHATAYAGGKQHHFRVKTLGPVRWRATGEHHNLRLVVIAPLGYRLRKNGKILYRKPAYLICTDPHMNVENFLQYYLWRWDIEVNFRDEKSLLGLGQAQVHHPQSVENVPALTVAAYAILLTAATSLYGLRGRPHELPPPKWRRQQQPRASTQNLIAQIRHDLWGQAILFSDFDSSTTNNSKSQKNKPQLDAALFYAA